MFTRTSSWLLNGILFGDDPVGMRPRVRVRCPSVDGRRRRRSAVVECRSAGPPPRSRCAGVLQEFRARARTRRSGKRPVGHLQGGRFHRGVRPASDRPRWPHHGDRSSGNPKISSSTAPELADAPARLRLKARPMLRGLETALPATCRWKSHPAALTPATQSPIGAAASAASRSATGSNTGMIVSGEPVEPPGSAGDGPATGREPTVTESVDPQAAAKQQTRTSEPSSLVTAAIPIRRSGSTPGSGDRRPRWRGAEVSAFRVVDRTRGFRPPPE